MVTIYYLLIPAIFLAALFSIGPAFVLNGARKSKLTLPPRDHLQIRLSWFLLLLVLLAEVIWLFKAMKNSVVLNPFISIALLLFPFFLGLFCISRCLFVLAGSPPVNKSLRKLALAARYQSWFILLLTIGCVVLALLNNQP